MLVGVLIALLFPAWGELAFKGVRFRSVDSNEYEVRAVFATEVPELNTDFGCQVDCLRSYSRQKQEFTLEIVTECGCEHLLAKIVSEPQLSESNDISALETEEKGNEVLENAEVESIQEFHEIPKYANAIQEIVNQRKATSQDLQLDKEDVQETQDSLEDTQVDVESDELPGAKEIQETTDNANMMEVASENSQEVIEKIEEVQETEVQNTEVQETEVQETEVQETEVQETEVQETEVQDSSKIGEELDKVVEPEVIDNSNAEEARTEESATENTAEVVNALDYSEIAGQTVEEIVLESDVSAPQFLDEETQISSTKTDSLKSVSCESRCRDTYQDARDFKECVVEYCPSPPSKTNWFAIFSMFVLGFVGLYYLKKYFRGKKTRTYLLNEDAELHYKQL